MSKTVDNPSYSFLMGMDLHDSIWVNGINKNILRVVGGWIYSDYDGEKQTLYNSTYVPIA